MNNELKAPAAKPAGMRVSAVAAASLLALLTLAGCATGPEYQRPDAPLAASFHTSGALAERKTALPAPALDTWWNGFNDPALQRIVTRVLEQNLDLAAAMARVDQARAASRLADARLLPEGRCRPESRISGNL